MSRDRAGPGRQAERTALAWQRTGLSVVVAAAVLARLTYEDLGTWALVSLAVCIGRCGRMLLGAGRRAPVPAERRGVAGWGAAVGASITVLGLTELAALVTG